MGKTHPPAASRSPPTGGRAASQACARTGTQTGDLSVSGTTPNPPNHTVGAQKVLVDLILLFPMTEERKERQGDPPGSQPDGGRGWPGDSYFQQGSPTGEHQEILPGAPGCPLSSRQQTGSPGRPRGVESALTAGQGWKPLVPAPSLPAPTGRRLLGVGGIST